MEKLKVKQENPDVIIRSINDIRRAIVPFTKDKVDKVAISGDVEWFDEDGKGYTTKVESYSSDVNYRESLIDGLNHAEEQRKMWNNIRKALEEDEYGCNLPEPNIDNFKMPVDRLIKRKLGGKRVGKLVKWNVENKTVVFDPYSKKLEIEE
jgi:hypothetical protein